MILYSSANDRRFTRLATSQPFLNPCVIYLPRANSSDEVARAKANDVSRDRSTSFTCRNGNQSVNFWREKLD